MSSHWLLERRCSEAGLWKLILWVHLNMILTWRFVVLSIEESKISIYAHTVAARIIRIYWWLCENTSSCKNKTKRWCELGTSSVETSCLFAWLNWLRYDWHCDRSNVNIAQSHCYKRRKQNLFWNRTRQNFYDMAYFGA